MNVDILIIFVILGSLIMINYGNMILSNKSEQTKLWSNNNKNNISKYGITNIYKIMILIAMISGVYLVYYLVETSTQREEDQLLRYIGIVLFLSFSLVWALVPFKYSKFVLLMVSIGTVLLLSSIHDNSVEGSLATAATSFIFIHTFVITHYIKNFINMYNITLIDYKHYSCKQYDLFNLAVSNTVY